MKTKTIEELANIYVDYHKSKGKILGLKSFLPLTTFTRFCMNKKQVEYVSQELVDEWCKKRPGETDLSHNSRAGCIRQFLRYTNSCGYTSLTLPPKIQISRQKKVVSETELPLVETSISDIMDKYIFYMKASIRL